MRAKSQNDYKKLTIMEDVLVRIPTSDVALIIQFANRMGWKIEKKSSIISRFIEACRLNPSNALSDEEIQAEVNAVRYAR